MARFLLTLLIISLVGCSNNLAGDANGFVLKGSRILGMDTNDAATDYTFLQSYAAAQSIGVTAGTVHLDWSQDEGAGSGATSGTFTDTSSQLASANAFYPATATTSLVSLTVAPIDTGVMALPSDLNGSAMNSANVITRFNLFMDWVFARMPNTSFTSIQIGNEMDTLGAANTAAYWTQYQAFMTAVVAHIHSVKPDVKVGVTVTLYGLIGQGSNGATAKAGIVSLAGVVDEIGVTYYPLDTSFKMKSPSVVETDTAQVFATLPNTPIYFQEVGYATSAICNGSVANQTAFIDQIFQMWDEHASQVPFLALLRMNDFSAANAATVAGHYGLGGNTSFIAYLQTLGFRTDPAPSGFKSSWTELQNLTKARGWGQ